MMKLRSLGLLTLGALSLVGIGFGVGVTVYLPAPPVSLAEGRAPDWVPVATRSFADGRPVQVELPQSGQGEVYGTASGTVTAVHVAPGHQLRSGQPVANVDGRPIVALATAEPLWRDLRPGDRGSDVRALQAELARVGAKTATSGVVDTATLKAASTLTGTGDGSTIRLTSWMWLPAPSVHVERVNLTLGRRVGAAEAWLSLQARPQSARVQSMPADVSPGERVLVVGQAAPVGITSDGRIIDAAGLEAIAATSEYASARANATDGKVLVPASWQLATPLPLRAVPARALFGIATGSACVLTPDGAVRVRIIASELGQTLVSSQRQFTAVRPDPPAATACR